MAFLQRKFASDLNFTDICSSQCFPSDDDDFCISDCFNFCLYTCPDRLPPFPPPSSHHSLLPKRFIAATVVLGITVISLICLTVYYKFYSGPCIRRRRRSGGDERRNQINEDFIDEDHGPVLDHPIWYINTVGLQPAVINSITVCKYKKGDGLVEGTDCSVCLSEFEEDETLRLLPKCSHAFHIPCIDTWLRSHTNCPLCRAPIVVSNPNLEASPSNGGGEAQVGGSREGSGGGGDGDGEVRIEIPEEDELGLEGEDGGKRSEVEEGIQPLRRSVSVDSLSAFNISQALAVGVHRDDSVKESESIAPKRIGTNQGLIRFMAGSSIGRSLQIGPSSLKRSFSCGAKLFLQRYSRSSNSSSSSSVLPL